MDQPHEETTSLETLAGRVCSEDLLLRYERLVADVPDPEKFFAIPMFLLGSVARARGLHEGIAHAVATTNPHAAAPLLRQFTETLAAVVYVTLHPKYAGAFIHHPREQQVRGGPARKQPKQLIDWMESSGNAQGVAHMYAELSEATHYGSTAWSFPFRSQDETGAIDWSAEPRWKDEEAGRVLCRWTISASDAMEAWLINLADLWRRVERSGREGHSGFCAVHGPIPDKGVTTCPLPNSRLVDGQVEVFVCGLTLTAVPRP